MIKFLKMLKKMSLKFSVRFVVLLLNFCSIKLMMKHKRMTNPSEDQKTRRSR